MKALKILAKACREFDNDSEHSKDLFALAMSSEDKNLVIELIGNLLPSETDKDIELLSEAANKASRNMFKPRTKLQEDKKQKRFI